MIYRELLADGTLRLRGERCSYTFSKPGPAALLIVVTGQETGELGRAPLGEVAVEAALHAPVRLFIDLSGLTQVAPAVSDDWTAWFRANQPSLRRIDVLVASVFVQVTVAVSQWFSRTVGLMRIHKDAATFLAAIREEAPTFQRPPSG